MPQDRPHHEFSAGGVMVRDGREVAVVVPTRRAADGSRVLALPKGHPDGAETAADGGAREVREEAAAALTYSGEREMVQRALSALARPR